ncbi:hypothetical protein [Paenibacillus popilliae]|uniref:DNA and RNA helicase n=1 Tax=Paenibacillus popilliae ATCC 14706 TaxID=1212764 RepID=M9LLV9_PAEPP|nr:hypothetical protein [Paenibacillus popilliae]GAC44315.1 DNA and RNA helicase [Paenibacillus popilliae ATCC 14706]
MVEEREQQSQPPTNGISEVGVTKNAEKSAVSNAEESAGKASKGTGETEKYYRTMSQKNYNYLVNTGKVPATKETCISPSREYAAQYDGVLVEFEVATGTTKALEAVGVRNNTKELIEKYPDLPTASKSWNKKNAYFKVEGRKGKKAIGETQITIGLGTGQALGIFNKNIIKFKEIPR